MIIYTSCWFQYFGPGRIGISRGVPRNATAGYRIYRDLAPTADILSKAKTLSDYRPRYLGEVLAYLDPKKVMADLARLAGDDPPVLLCWERTPLTESNFCHRTMVADWLNKHGATVEEWSGVQETNLQQHRLDV